MSHVLITALDQEGRGIARVDGKAIFIEGALIGERVTYKVKRRKPTYELAAVDQVETPSPSRVVPRCPYFGICGGCSLQHLDATTQVAAKQRVLEDALWHIGRLRAESLLPAIYGPAWEYRHRARFSVRDVTKKGGVLVGFHEKKSSYVADMEHCEVVPARISALLLPLRRLVEGLSIRDRLPQIELAIGDVVGAPVDALALRILEPLTPADEASLRSFAAEHGIRFYLQPGGPATMHPLCEAEAPLSYSLPEFDLVFRFEPTDFTQVNSAMNRVLVRRAVGLLAPRAGDRIADFFCGLGNFTLPMARRGAEVVGIEGSRALVERARDNARANRLQGSASFVVADLFAASQAGIAALGTFNKMLIDPPRDGAMALVKALPAPEADGLRALVYVSCNPATLARDAGFLVHEKGWRLRAAGIVNMFPHTAHVESIAHFEA